MGNGTRLVQIKTADGHVQGYHVGSDTIPLDRPARPGEDPTRLVSRAEVADRVQAAVMVTRNDYDTNEPTNLGGALPAGSNGWRKESVWRNNGNYGDTWVGNSYEARYQTGPNADGDYSTVNFGYFVEPDRVPDGSGNFGFRVVEYLEHTVHADPDDVGGDSDIEYDFTADPQLYDTLEDAERSAERLARRDARDYFD